MSAVSLLIASASVASFLLCFGLAVDHYRSGRRKLAEQLRRQTEAASRAGEGEARYRVLFEHAPVGWLVWEPGFKVLEWNRQAERIFGWTRDEMLGRSILGTLIPDQAREEMLRDAAVLFAKGKLHHAAVPHVTRDGRSISCEWRHALMRGADGAPAQVVSLCVDVTGFRQLALESALFRSAVELTSDPSILLLDIKSNGRVVYANDAACRHFGRSTEELVGTTPRDWDLHDCPERSTSLRSDRETEQLLTFESEHRHSSGATIPVEVTMNSIRHDRRIYAAVYIRNIAARRADETRRRQLEVQAAISEQERRYREIFEHSSDALFIIVARDGGRLVLEELNPAAERAFGLSATVLTGLDFAAGADDPPDGYAGARLSGQARHYLRCAATGSAVDFEDSLDLTANPTAAARHFHVQLIPLADEDGGTRILGVARDITEIRLGETRLRESRALLQQLSAHRENAREVERKHIAQELHEELAQLLSGLRMKIATLRLKYGGDLPGFSQDASDMLDITDRTIRSVRQAVTDLRPTTLDAGLAVGLEWLVRRTTEQSGVACRLQLPEEALDFADAQATAIFRIVQEALDNVARHARARRADVVLSRRENHWLLKVRDNGRGFDAKARPKGSFGIIGMWERALMLGGELDIASSPRHGTVLKVRIPGQATSRPNVS